MVLESLTSSRQNQQARFLLPFFHSFFNPQELVLAPRSHLLNNLLAIPLPIYSNYILKAYYDSSNRLVSHRDYESSVLPYFKSSVLANTTKLPYRAYTGENSMPAKITARGLEASWLAYAFNARRRVLRAKLKQKSRSTHTPTRG